MFICLVIEIVFNFLPTEKEFWGFWSLHVCCPVFSLPVLGSLELQKTYKIKILLLIILRLIDFVVSLFKIRGWMNLGGFGEY